MVLDFIRKPSLKYRVVRCCQVTDLQISLLYAKFKCCNRDKSVSPPKASHQNGTASKELPHQPSAVTGGGLFYYTNALFTNSEWVKP